MRNRIFRKKEYSSLEQVHDDNRKDDTEHMYTTIELFAGAGGLALGIEKAGFETLGLIEFDKDASDTLKKNRPNWNVINDDIANISCLNLEEYFELKKGELDLLSGGAPCQAFSYAGKKLGLEDARGTLFYHYATFLEKLQPKMFLFENVRGLLTHDRGRTYKTITTIFEQAGYTNITTTANGKECWDKLQEYNASGSLDSKVACIITDIEMPQMDGHHLTKKIKSDERFNGLPVVIFSSLVNDEMKRKGEALGVDAQLSKPEIGKLVHQLDLLLQ